MAADNLRLTECSPVMLESMWRMRISEGPVARGASGQVTLAWPVGAVQSRNPHQSVQERCFCIPSRKDHTAPIAQNACSEDIDSANALLRGAVSTFNGKWKLEILWLLSRGTLRFNALRRELPGITQHMLTNQLRELER